MFYSNSNYFDDYIIHKLFDENELKLIAFLGDDCPNQDLVFELENHNWKTIMFSKHKNNIKLKHNNYILKLAVKDIETIQKIKPNVIYINGIEFRNAKIYFRELADFSKLLVFNLGNTKINHEFVKINGLSEFVIRQSPEMIFVSKDLSFAENSLKIIESLSYHDVISSKISNEYKIDLEQKQNIINELVTQQQIIHNSEVIKLANEIIKVLKLWNNFKSKIKINFKRHINLDENSAQEKPEFSHSQYLQKCLLNTQIENFIEWQTPIIKAVELGDLNYPTHSTKATVVNEKFSLFRHLDLALLQKIRDSELSIRFKVNNHVTHEIAEYLVIHTFLALLGRFPERRALENFAQELCKSQDYVVFKNTIMESEEYKRIVK